MSVSVTLSCIHTDTYNIGAMEQMVGNLRSHPHHFSSPRRCRFLFSSDFPIFPFHCNASHTISYMLKGVFLPPSLPFFFFFFSFVHHLLPCIVSIFILTTIFYVYTLESTYNGHGMAQQQQKQQHHHHHRQFQLLINVPSFLQLVWSVAQFNRNARDTKMLFFTEGNAERSNDSVLV